MAKRSHQNWATLIKQQTASGLTITAFCRQHKFNISTFYTRKANSNDDSNSTGDPFTASNRGMDFPKLVASKLPT